MVALRILVPPVRVRVLPGQQFSETEGLITFDKTLCRFITPLLYGRNMLNSNIGRKEYCFYSYLIISKQNAVSKMCAYGRKSILPKACYS